MKKILFISPEVSPYTESSELADSIIKEAKKISKKKNEVRVFVPKYKCIKDRKHQLHEVIRFSGLNINVDGVFQPLTLKVTTIPKEKIQIYFIENEDYFNRDGNIYDDKGNMFEDADRRAIMYSKATLEIVKKLNWKPDTITLQGWMSYLTVPFLKDFYKNDETFKDASLILNYFSEKDFGSFSVDSLKKMLEKNGISPEFAEQYSDNSYKKLLETTVRNSDHILEEDKFLSKMFSSVNKDAFIEKSSIEVDKFLCEKIMLGD